MKYIVVDLEMNPIAREYREQRSICRNEVIEIGAVMLDEKYHEICSFMTYVKPQYNDIIEPKIQRLTGIDIEMVAEAPGFEEAFKMFTAWCANLYDEYQVIQWSDSDSSQLLAEMELKHYVMDAHEQELMKKFVDFQRDFTNMLGFQNPVSLEKAISYAGENFEGRPHDALFDARNTADLFGIARDTSRQDALAKVIEVLTPKPCTSSLGEMFDFSAFIQMCS